MMTTIWQCGQCVFAVVSIIACIAVFIDIWCGVRDKDWRQ